MNYFNDKGQCFSKFYVHTSPPPHLAKMEGLIQKVCGGETMKFSFLKSPR